jgi:hypothetical protein
MMMLGFLDLFIFHLGQLSKRIIFLTALRSGVAEVAILTLEAGPSSRIIPLLSILNIAQATQLRKLLRFIIGGCTSNYEVVDVIVIYLGAVIYGRIRNVTSHVVDYVCDYFSILLSNSSSGLLNHLLRGRPRLLVLALWFRLLFGLVIFVDRLRAGSPLLLRFSLSLLGPTRKNDLAHILKIIVSFFQVR